jgi:hypothetical protein
VVGIVINILSVIVISIGPVLQFSYLFYLGYIFGIFPSFSFGNMLGRINMKIFVSEQYLFNNNTLSNYTTENFFASSSYGPDYSSLVYIIIVSMIFLVLSM